LKAKLRKRARCSTTDPPEHQSKASEELAVAEQKLSELNADLQLWEDHLRKVILVLAGGNNNAVLNDQIVNSPGVRMVRQSLDALSPQLRNPWSKDVGSVAKLNAEAGKKDEQLRQQVANSYRCKKNSSDAGGKPVTFARCCVTQLEGDHNHVTAAHLLPRRSAPQFLKTFDMSDEPMGIDCYRNIILLAKNIEAGFNDQRLCFVKNDDKTEIVLQILDPAIANEPIFPGASSTIGDYAGKPLKFRERAGPFTRILSLHAQLSYQVAKQMTLITEEEPIPEKCKYGSPVVGDTVHCLADDFELSMSGNSSTVSMSDDAVLKLETLFTLERGDSV